MCQGGAVRPTLNRKHVFSGESLLPRVYNLAEKQIKNENKKDSRNCRNSNIMLFSWRKPIRVNEFTIKTRAVS